LRKLSLWSVRNVTKSSAVSSAAQLGEPGRPFAKRQVEAHVINGALRSDYMGLIEKEIQDCLCFGISLPTGPMIARTIAVARNVKHLQKEPEHISRLRFSRLRRTQFLNAE
jgi:hypothetical protein